MKYLFLLSCSLFCVSPAQAQDVPEDPDCCWDPAGKRPEEFSILVTGSRSAIDQTGQSVSVIGRAELQTIQGPDLTRTLERLPGVTITRNGGLGNFTGLRVRGADAEQLLVLIDGVRVADQASPAGGYDLGNLLSGELERVDLLRGSNSVIWGSQAIGGVLAITSRDRTGVTASAEYGSRVSFASAAGAGLGTSVYSLGLTAGYTRTDGISTAAVGTEADAFRQWHIGGRGHVEIASGLTARVTARYADSKLDIDGFPAPFYSFADTPEYQTTKDASGRAGLDYQADGFSLGGGFAISDTRRAYFDPTFGSAANYETFGRAERAELTGHADLPSDFTLDFGADSEWTRFHSSFDPVHKARLSSGHALLGYHNGALNLSAGARVDDHSQFGTHWTLGANASVNLGGDWRMRASFGEGFKAPTLFQLLSDFGNAGLRPESSRSLDLGVELGDRNAPLHFAVTVFRRDSTDLIDFVSCFGRTTGICTARPFGTYDNVSRARASGFEVEGAARPTETLSLRAAYSYVKAQNLVSQKDLARRPRHALSLSADWETPLAGVKLGADLRMVSRSFDDAGNFTPLDGYTLATLRASVPVGERFELYGRVENVGNARYQTAAGYGTAGRSAFVGARARF